MKAMLSQPMAGKTDEEIIATREKAVKALQERGYKVVNTLFTDEWYSNESMKERGVVQIPLCFLAKSLENMSLCHAAYFCKGWENARGCRIEHDAAVAYGLDIIYEEQKGKVKTMGSQEFLNIAKAKVAEYFNSNKDKTDAEGNLTVNDVFVVWYCKTLQNHKALLSTPVSDGMYYEITYNGDKNELYFDAYKKWENICFNLQEVIHYLPAAG